MVRGVALLVYSTAELISCFMADLQSDGQTEEMAAALSLLPAQGLVKEGIKLATHAQALTHRHRQTSGLFLTKMCICIFSLYLCVYIKTFGGTTYMQYTLASSVHLKTYPRHEY